MNLVGGSRFRLDYTDPRPDSNYDAEQLKLGIEVEKEHINYGEMSKIIAKDHLDFHKYYYTVLEEMEEKNGAVHQDDEDKKTIERINNPYLDDRPDERYSARELAMGIKVEMEHTNSEAISKMIAKDHLDELPNYYTLLHQYNLVNNKPDNIINSMKNGGLFL